MQRKGDLELSNDLCCVMAKIMNEFECRGEREILEKHSHNILCLKLRKSLGRKFDAGFNEFNQL